VSRRSLSALKAAAVMVGVIALDQIVKAIVRSSIDLGASDELLPFLKLVNVRNTGVAFSMFEGGGALLVVFAVIATVALLAFFYAHAERPLAWLPTGLLLGGALGNLIDRVRDGAVTDFIKFTAWPAFNVADIAITLGVLALLYVLEGPPREAERKERSHAAEAG
jgi:signal peptidase II